ncbi:SDR family oxidoreductase [Paraburkholderia phytofirmans]|uniref:SDR family NAD(P)-dependent oxidoreductase n=1 Tax=Paraburkholderia phytofirmans TaxID=261302 RepID=UPI0038BCF9F8
MNRLADKIAFIAGGAGGIGAAAAHLFAREGCQVAIGDRDFDAARRTVAAIKQEGGHAAAFPLDVTQEGSVRAAIGNAVEAFGGLDVLYNNVGGSSTKDAAVTEAPLEEFWRCINVDLFGTWLGCRHGIPELIKRGGGSVINTSSILALMGSPNKDAYTAAKGAVSALTRSMAVEYAPHKIRVNAIAPGITRTPRVERLLDEDGVTARLSENYLLGILEPIDIAQMALYLASDESRLTTGQILSVDSGASIV